MGEIKCTGIVNGYDYFHLTSSMPSSLVPLETAAPRDTNRELHFERAPSALKAELSKVLWVKKKSKIKENHTI